MFKKLTVNNQPSLLLLLVIMIFCVPIIQANGFVSNTHASPIDIYLVTNTEAVYQRDQFNMSLSIVNVHHEEIPNITIKITIPSELEFLDSSAPELIVEENATELIYKLGSLELDEIVLFTVVYNVTSSITKQLTLDGATVSYQLINGISSDHISESITIFLKGPRAETETNTLPELPEPKFNADDYPLLIMIAYTLPIVTFAFSVVYLRRIRR